MTPEQLAARNAAIKSAWDDPLRRALARSMKEKPGSRSSSVATAREYYRRYRSRREKRPETQFTAAELAACVAREIKRRRRLYRSRVAKGRMGAETAERELAQMLAIRDHFRRINFVGDQK